MEGILLIHKHPTKAEGEGEANASVGKDDSRISTQKGTSPRG